MMNNSEIHEIKKRLKFCDDASFKIETCYVIGSEKRIQSRMNTYLTNLDDSERHKYLEILKKGLSGVLNRNLLNLSFERSMQGPDAQKFLLSLRDGELADKEVSDKYYDMIIRSYSTVGNYLIITLYDAYDVPKEGTDGFSIRLGRFFGMSDRFFLDMQNDIEVRELIEKLDGDITTIKPYTAVAM